ncbi:hypothetical protein [Schleiferilactobacillus perolens]|uniref:ABC transporter permease n=1 Tax=Schleiferilactobacillus perolens DSM 12744 TaxID=1423792 RepID=A0A0R1MSN3_9LACO|nr:hypothetical protein [Schleiferilactobacillus perolens]KRL11341.1 hypothetical protein FD09_GL000710 [Schleiferilactobacillus perolens DSM 12744]
MVYTFGQLTIKEIRANEFLPSLLTIAFCGIIPILFTLHPTTIAQAALPGEMFMPLVAILCFGGIFLPEQVAGVADVLNSKRTQLLTIYLIRLGWYTLLLSLVNTLLILSYQLPTATAVLWFDFLTKALFIGSLTVFSYAAFGSLAAAYLIPTVYFTLCLGYPHLGPLNLMVLMRQQSWTDNWWQLGVAVIFLVVGFRLLRNAAAKS